MLWKRSAVIVRLLRLERFENLIELFVSQRASQTTHRIEPEHRLRRRQLPRKEPSHEPSIVLALKLRDEQVRLLLHVADDDEDGSEKTSPNGE
ncbi:MAG: hypothetical protein ABSB50_02825 [Terracidiphilus sp.]|jgi:hypothetical protein